MKKKDAKYAPSNGVEGETFMKSFCYACAKHEDGACEILNRALAFGITDDGYPEEWVYTLSTSAKEMLGSARCTAFVATLSAMTKENPFETSEQSEGQNLIDETIEPTIEIIKEALADDGSHKCDTCSLEFATCESGQVVFGIDIDPDATGKEADRVVTCGAYVAHNLSEVAAYSPSPLDKFGTKFEKYLPVPVPEEELAGYAQEMARIHARWVKTKLDAKAFAKSCKNVTDECEERELEIAEIINAGEEERKVQVFWSYDFTHHVKRLVRMDTNQVVEEVALEPDDYQTDLPLFDAENQPDPVEAFKTGNVEGDSGGVIEETSQIEDSEETEIEDRGSSYRGENEGYDEEPQGDIYEGVKTADLDKGWPDPPERVA